MIRDTFIYSSKLDLLPKSTKSMFKCYCTVLCKDIRVGHEQVGTQPTQQYQWNNNVILKTTEDCQNLVF